MKHLDSIGEQIRKLRENAKMPLRQLASILEIDQSTLSKIERGERKANTQIIEQIAHIFSMNIEDLLVNFYSDIVSYQIGEEKTYSKILKVAEAKIEYKRALKIKGYGKLS